MNPAPIVPPLASFGCGNIGGKQAANFLAHGYSVYVYDVDRDSMANLFQTLYATFRTIFTLPLQGHFPVPRGNS